MVLHIIRADILLIARIFPRPFGARKNTTQLTKYPRVLYAKPSIKIYISPLNCNKMLFFWRVAVPHHAFSEYLGKFSFCDDITLGQCSGL